MFLPKKPAAAGFLLVKKLSMKLGSTMNKKIAVFDSGLGGLTVLKKLAQGLPNENFLYLGDTARLPYGSKSSSTIRSYVEQNMRLLKSLSELKAIVIACNSASTTIKESEFDKIPVFEVISAGALAATKASQNQKIGVIATHATTENQSYSLAIQRLNPNAVIFSKATPLLVPLVEEGLFSGKITKDILDLYLSNFDGSDIDTLILGCTHYPLLSLEIESFFENKINLVEPSEILIEFITKSIPLNTKKNKQSLELHFTDTHPRYQQLIEKIMHPFIIDSIKHININC
jgi:glutamate racemase